MLDCITKIVFGCARKVKIVSEHQLTQSELAEMNDVLTHPDHTRGLEEGELVVTALEVLSSTFIRIRGRLEGFRNPDAWRRPNTTLRLEVPVDNDVIEGIATSSRVYTIAEVFGDYDVAIDAVAHGTTSPMMRWLASVNPGDRIVVKGPRPHQLLNPASVNYMLADASALPAVRNILLHQREVKEKPTVVIAAPQADAEAYVADCVDRATIIHLGGTGDLAAACVELGIGASATVWAAGERDLMRAIRRYCKEDLGLERSALRIFGYWKEGTSHTLLDVARMRAAKRRVESGLGLDGADDFDLEI